jgi:Leucine-rich repeat (LRR) protein
VEDSRHLKPEFLENAISSMSKLLQLLPSTNTNCSPIIFPKLQTMDLNNFALSKSNFFRPFVCCPTLTELDLSRSDIVTLPPCIRRFVRLKSLYLINCKQLQKILELPLNVRRVEASGCVSLAIFFHLIF